MGKQRNKKKQAARVHKPLVTSQLRAQAATQGPFPREASSLPESAPKQLSLEAPVGIRMTLSKVNLLVTVVAVGVLLVVYIKYAPLRPEETEELFSVVLPILFLVASAKSVCTMLMFKSVSASTAESVRATNRLILLRTALAVLTVGISIYPLIYLAGLPDVVAQLVLKVFPRFTSQVVAVLSQFATWVVAGFAGWIGNIFLSVVGNLLADVVKGKFLNRRRLGDARANLGSSNRVGEGKRAS